MPVNFPVNLVKPNRALAYIARRHPTHLPTAFEALYHQFWGLEISNVNIGQPDGAAGFLKVLREVLPSEVYEDVEKQWSGEEAKALLVENTERAEKEGVFGCPWFDCENEKGEREGFWGLDHLGQVVRFMGLEGRDENQQVLKALL
jgi:2-hydroxychromene-2-carboxylate isomerase